MYQVTFSEQSMLELNRLDKLAQLEAIEPISKIRPVDLAHPREPLGKFNRAGKDFYRLRAGANIGGRGPEPGRSTVVSGAGFH